LFLYQLELGGGETYHLAPLSCGLSGGALEPRGGAVPDYPNLVCLKSLRKMTDERWRRLQNAQKDRTRRQSIVMGTTRILFED
jgi:hypothetical protein